MVIRERFFQDPAWVQVMQQETFVFHTSLMFNEAKRRYLYAENIFGRETELGNTIRELIDFDAKRLVKPHDVIALWFRYSKRSELEQFFLPSSISMVDHDLYWDIQWRGFIRTKIEKLMDGDPSMVRHTLDCVLADQNSLQWTNAQSLLCGKLRMLYDEWNPDNILPQIDFL